MAELACAVDPRFEVSRLEERTLRSYSIDTIEKVRAGMTPHDELYFRTAARSRRGACWFRRSRSVHNGLRYGSRIGEASDRLEQRQPSERQAGAEQRPGHDAREPAVAGRPATVPCVSLHVIL